MPTSRMQIVQGDITHLSVEAVVNAANEDLWEGGGVCGAIFRAAGGDLQSECKQLAPCPVGSAVLTHGYGLSPARIIHAVGPQFHQYSLEDAESLLASAYRESLRIASEKGLKSIAFPSISTGIYGFPIERACPIALKTVAAFLKDHPLPQEVLFCCYGKPDFDLYVKNLAELPSRL